MTMVIDSEVVTDALGRMDAGAISGRDVATILDVDYMKFRDGLRGRGSLKWLQAARLGKAVNMADDIELMTWQAFEDKCFAMGLFRHLKRLDDGGRSTVFRQFIRHLKACQNLDVEPDPNFLNDAIFEAARLQRQNARV